MTEPIDTTVHTLANKWGSTILEIISRLANVLTGITTLLWPSNVAGSSQKIKTLPPSIVSSYVDTRILTLNQDP